MNLNFKGTRLLVCNYEACIEFYQNTLGFELVYQDKNGEEADLKMGDTTLNLIKRQSMSSIIGAVEDVSAENATDNVALIFTTPDLDETCKQLEAKNVEFITKPMYRPQWGIKTTYLRDPDSNLVGIYQLTDYTGI